MTLPGMLRLKGWITGERDGLMLGTTLYDRTLVWLALG